MRCFFVSVSVGYNLLGKKGYVVVVVVVVSVGYNSIKSRG